MARKQIESQQLAQDEKPKEKLEDMPLEELLEQEAKIDGEIAKINAEIKRREVLRRVQDKTERAQQLKKELEALRRGERSVGQEHEAGIVK